MTTEQEIKKLEQALEQEKDNFLVKQAISDRLDKLRKSLKGSTGRTSLTADNVEVKVGDKVYRFRMPRSWMEEGKRGLREPEIEEYLIVEIRGGGKALVKGSNPQRFYSGDYKPLGPDSDKKQARMYSGEGRMAVYFYSTPQAAKAQMIKTCEYEYTRATKALQSYQQAVHDAKTELAKARAFKLKDVTRLQAEAPKPPAPFQATQSFISSEMEGVK